MTKPTLPQIILQVLSNLEDPSDAARFFQTSRTGHGFADSLSLNKALFLSLFDPPPSSRTGSEKFPWATSLRARVRARGWLRTSTTVEALTASTEDFGSTLETLVEIALTRVVSSTHLSRNQVFLETHLDSLAIDELGRKRKGGHALRQSARDRDPTSRLVQLASCLSALHSPTPHALGSPLARTAAREVVYWQENWQRSSSWGPFIAGSAGRKSQPGLVVDWAKLEALALVMAANMKEVEGTGWGGDDVEVPRGWESTRPGELPEGKDWAGVESQVSRLPPVRCLGGHRLLIEVPCRSPLWEHMPSWTTGLSRYHSFLLH